MNATQINAFRNIAATMHAASETMTAREMAFQSHSLNHDASIATMPDGRKWAWSETLFAWVRYA